MKKLSNLEFDFPETLTSYSSINAAKRGAERLAKQMRDIFAEDGK